MVVIECSSGGSEQRWRKNEQQPCQTEPRRLDINGYSAAFAALAPNMRVGAGKPQEVPSVTLT
jgi:hypothetical protein